MDCEQLFRVLPDYLDEEMKRELCGELQAHLRECSYCRAHVHTMQSTVELTRKLGTPPVHQEWVLRLKTRLLDEEPPGTA